MVFIDYTTAFDSLFHKFIDETLAKTGASTKIRSMFHAVYKSASTYTAVRATDGKQVKSIPFQVNRGVIQGDITSPLCFIMTLELILRRYDSNARRGVQLADSLIHILGVYADDAALTEFGDEEGTQRLPSRVKIIIIIINLFIQEEYWK